MQDRQAGLNSLVNSLSNAERDWLLRRLLGRPRGRHLAKNNSAMELLNAELWFFNRIDSARTPAVRQARIRMWLIFMLLRHGALRPREILSLQPRDLNLPDGYVEIGGDFPRRVWLPLEAARRMRQVLEEFAGNPQFLQCDSAQTRRNLRQCEEACNLRPGALSPSALRKNRARELELAGLPYALINLFMGRPASGDSLLDDFENPGQILKIHIQEERPMKTSARNVFQGKVSKICQNGILAEIVLKTAADLEITSMITETSFKSLAICEGKLLNALVKAPFVSVIPAEDRALAAAENRFKGVVREIHADDMAEEILVELDGGNMVCALYARGARPGANVDKGREVLVCFSAFSVILNEE